MNRVLVTGGADAIGAAVVRRLLRDPDFEVRVADQRELPGWMREGCEVRRGDLRLAAEAEKAVAGCSHVIHLAALAGGPSTLLEVNGALLRAALDGGVTRFAYVSSEAVYERAQAAPLTEAHLGECPPPRSAIGFSQLAGELQCRAANDEHGLPFTICRPIGAHVSDAADGIVTAMASPAGLDEDFNLAAGDGAASAEKAERLLGWRARLP